MLLTEIIENRKQEVIESRNRGESQELRDKDLLTMLIEANLNDEDGTSFMTDRELISNLSIFYAAGHEVGDDRALIFGCNLITCVKF
jgi:cytochrome P450